MPQGKIITVNLSDLVLRDEIQIRQGITDNAWKQYAEWIEEGSEPPPLQVIQEHGTGALLLADGWHRKKALESVGRATAHANVSPGTAFDALMLSCDSNSKIGLTLGRADRRRAIYLILSQPEGYALHNREIARRTGTTHPTVADVRMDMYHTEDVTPTLPKELQSGKKVAIPEPTPNPMMDEALGYESAPADLGWVNPGPISHSRAQPQYQSSGHSGTRSSSSHTNGSVSHGDVRSVISIMITYTLDDGTTDTVSINGAIPEPVRKLLRNV